MTDLSQEVIFIGISLAVFFGAGFWLGRGFKESIEFKRVQTRKDNRIFTRPPNPNRFNHHL